jgi:2-amino-4-hydroxy-6-hydroxymethyldihydropteridine diphosphokinase
MFNTAFLLLGGNLGNIGEVFSSARYWIGEIVGPVIDSSSLYQSEPWGFESSDLFLNQVLVVHTKSNASELLEKIMSIEKSLGRNRDASFYTSRSIDIDILFFNEEIIDTMELVVPHPRLHLRNFTLEPLCEVSPGKIHPVFNRTVLELLHDSQDNIIVSKVSNDYVNSAPDEI